MRRRKKLFAVCAEVGLTKEERLELACALLYRDIVSFKDLDDAQVIRCLDAVEGFQKITWLLQNRPTW